MLTFKDVKFGTWEESMEAISLVVKDEYKRHPELLTSTILDTDAKNYIVSAQQSLSQNHEQLWIPAERGYAASNSMKWMESDPLSLSAK